MGAVLPDMVLKELDPRVLVVDSLALRGLGIKGLLRQWALERGVELDFWDPTAPIDPDPTAFTYRLGILSLGHMSIGDRVALGWLAHVRRIHPDTPLVIWSDLPAPHEALHALQHGVQGFVPTMTTPQLALQALTFIMNGGTYFSPEALIETSLPEEPRAAPDISRSKPDGPNGYGGNGKTSRHVTGQMPSAEKAQALSRGRDRGDRNDRGKGYHRGLRGRE